MHIIYKLTLYIYKCSLNANRYFSFSDGRKLKNRKRKTRDCPNFSKSGAPLFLTILNISVFHHHGCHHTVHW